MKASPNPRKRLAPGLTTMELSTVIGVIISLALVTFAGANAWKNDSSRSLCISKARSVQLAVRSYQKVHDYHPGAKVCEFNGTTSIAKHIYDLKYITSDTYKQVLGNEPCPGGGTYSSASLDHFPPVGELFIECSLADSQSHGPGFRPDW
jgi:hypothetical protein